VGNSYGPNERATPWSGGNGPIDLNTLLPANSGWVLNVARGINNKGQIVGTGTINGHEHLPPTGGE
jgi:hypothetical protein